ncbi:uncharacterized protein LOC111119046 [Crassostrea virginica]
MWTTRSFHLSAHYRVLRHIEQCRYIHRRHKLHLPLLQLTLEFVAVNVRFNNIMDSQEMPKELMERMKVIVQAETQGKHQIALLNNKIRDLAVRIKRCSQSGNKALKYTLEHRKRVAQNVRAVYHRYVMKKKVDAARLLIRDFMRQTLPVVRNRVIGQQILSPTEEAA